MRKPVVSLSATCLLFCVNGLFAQTNPTGNFSCSVTDPSNAAVPHASVQLTEATNGTTFKTVSGSDGHCFIANVPPGTYTATITAAGFQIGSFKSVQIAVGQTYDLRAPLQVGEVSSTVTVDAGQQLLETTDSSVSTSVSGPIITHLPSASNSALWGVGMMSPDIQTIGGPRQSSADGLPGGVVNITYDGISAQWQPGKSGDPLFTMVYTNADAVAEFSMSSAAASASETGEGAIQIKMVSPRGSNQFHGGVWEYFRNDDLNSNYYFNNLAGPAAAASPLQPIWLQDWWTHHQRQTLLLHRSGLLEPSAGRVAYPHDPGAQRRQRHLHVYPRGHANIYAVLGDMQCVGWNVRGQSLSDGRCIRRHLEGRSGGRPGVGGYPVVNDRSGRTRRRGAFAISAGHYIQ
jgi:hypothetical protein